MRVDVYLTVPDELLPIVRHPVFWETLVTLPISVWESLDEDVFRYHFGRNFLVRFGLFVNSDKLRYYNNLLKNLPKRWLWLKRVKKTVNLPPEIVDIIQAYASLNHMSFSDALATMIDNCVRSHVGDRMLKVIKEYERYKAMAMKEELKGYIEAKKHIETFLQWLETQLEELESEYNQIDIVSMLKDIYEFFDRNGMDYDRLEIFHSDTLDKIRKYFRTIYGVEFDVQKFAEECWLKDISVEDWLKKFESV